MQAKMYTSGPITGRGWCLMERGFMDLQIFAEEPYTEREAWIYLIENAAFKPIIREVDGMAIPLKQGQLVASCRYLAEAWGWRTKGGYAKDRVLRLLGKFQRHSWISIGTDYSVERDNYEAVSDKKYNRRPMLITLLHYNELQRKNDDELFFNGEMDLARAETALRQLCDKPKQIPANKDKTIKNHGLTRDNGDVFLFDMFSQVNNSEEFIYYMPGSWQNYALHDKKWSIEKVGDEAKNFWERYAGKNLEERSKNRNRLEKRTHWKKVWEKWCDQRFRS